MVSVEGVFVEDVPNVRSPVPRSFGRSFIPHCPAEPDARRSLLSE
jgi:hypothetical protein